MLQIYRSYVKPCYTYAAPIWSPTASDTSVKKIQTSCNSAYRVITGCLASSPIQHLMDEVEELPVDAHVKMLTTQFCAQAFLNPCHPNHMEIQDPPPRSVRLALSHILHSSDKSHWTNNPAAATAAIHTSSVATYLASRAPNTVLGTIPPTISKSEASLDRKDRVRLAQVRCGHSPILGVFMARIKKPPDKSRHCSHCKTANHDAIHLFTCPLFPTQLKPVDLWNKPAEAITLINRQTNPD